MRFRIHEENQSGRQNGMFYLSRGATATARLYQFVVGYLA